LKPSVTQLVVLDPGLREQGGHHPAFILALLATDCFTGDNSKLRVFANAEFIPSAVFDSATNNVKYTAFFKTDFYRYFYESTHHPELPHFIRRLTAEYLAAMQQVVEDDCQLRTVKGCGSILFCHALGWEHATALANALFLFKKPSAITLRVVVILMFSPYRKTANDQYDSQLYLRYRVAFKGLAACDGVSFFACDHETSKAYEHVLSRYIGIIPTPFVSARKHRPSKPNKDKKIVLYLGDSKATKGFLALPNILEQIIKLGQNEDVSYLIQYSLTNKSEEFLAVDKTLKRFAEVHPNIDVYEVFWSEQQLHETLASCHALVFNYDSSVYMYQSSGVLWLAACYNIKMFFLSSNWLTREAARLKSEYILCDPKKIIECLNELSHGDINRQTHYANICPLSGADYHAKLFGDFEEWLNSVLGAH
jgi:hypothetical protein|tara:strand:- start:567 stop:1835 length:1269 start_codon:yes stop_codon:yes gene_type:complete